MLEAGQKDLRVRRLEQRSELALERLLAQRRLETCTGQRRNKDRGTYFVGGVVVHQANHARLAGAAELGLDLRFDLLQEGAEGRLVGRGGGHEDGSAEGRA